ncbi:MULTISPECIES: hypothetical protein [unclassified Mameliella]|uniref:hypothetical protein n=1 Tax=unclassified Mameliella TaxID=2630630 RepID=UPI00273D7409|nr:MULTISPECIES: hypothetical protein [unclassified Mameliella]
MMTPHWPARLGRVICVFLFTLNATAATAETPIGSVVESRVLVGLTVAPDKMNAAMPEGWASVPFPAGPFKGANAMVSFLDGHLVLDAGGNPATPTQRTTAALLGLGKPPQSKDVRLFILKVYTDDPEANRYGSTHTASVTRSRTLSGSSDGARRLTERWTVAPEDGGEISLDLSYTLGTPRWGTGSSKGFSAEDTDFHVTQTYEQMADVAMSVAMGKPLDGEITLDATAAGLAALFDGQQEIVAVVNIPYYRRALSIP